METMLTESKYPRLLSVKKLTENLLNKNILSIFILLLIITSIAACRIDYDTGQELYTDILETSLHLGKSDMDEVLQVLGKPNGKGGFLLPSDPAGRVTWSYYYEKASVEIEERPNEQPSMALSGKSRRAFLFIYFNSNDKYDGYMWFSGTNKISN